MRFRTTCDGYTVISGKGDDGDQSRDNMTAAQMFVATLGMCFGVYIVGHCRNHDIPCDGLAIEIDRETAHAPGRTTRVAARIRMDAPLTDQERSAILKVAHRCHVQISIEQGIDIDIAFA